MQATSTNDPLAYMIPVGNADSRRLDALGAIYDGRSLELITSNSSSPNPKILDVGCGNGSLTCLFAKTLPNSAVVGVDISTEQITLCIKKATEENLTNLSWDVCNVYKLEDLKEKHPELFDIVHSRFLLTHIPDLSKAVDQMLSLVKPGGLLILEEVGAKKKFKGTPVKAIQAWKKMIDLQHSLQKSHHDAAEIIIKHLSESSKVSAHTSVLFNIKIEGQLKKSMYRMGAEHGVKKLAEMGKADLIKQFGYEDGIAWLQEMNAFEKDDSQTLEIEDNETIIAIKA